MSIHFDLVDLALMVHVAEANSITKAAELAHLSLPAASTRIKNLEEGIGAKLLYRTSQGVTLTPPGRALVQHARIVLTQLQHLRSDLQEYTTGIKGHLRILANTTALEYLPIVLRSYLLRHPDVNIDLRERLSNEIVRAVSEGQTDIGIVAGQVPTENLEVIPYRGERLVAVVARDHKLAGAAAIDFASTLEYDHVGLHEASAIHGFLSQVCVQLNRPLKLRIQVGSFEAACRMIEVTVGVAIVPESVARRHAQSMNISIVALSDAWAIRSMQICMRSFKGLPGFARELVDLLAADARSPQPPANPSRTPLDVSCAAASVAAD